MTAALLNYIEGEISFDILDVEGLEDITTAGRDNFSVQDERVKLLIVLCKGIVSDLIGLRQGISNNMEKYNKKMKELIEQQESEKLKSNSIKDKLSPKALLKTYQKKIKMHSKMILLNFQEPVDRQMTLILYL